MSPYVSQKQPYATWLWLASPWYEALIGLGLVKIPLFPWSNPSCRICTDISGGDDGRLFRQKHTQDFLEWLEEDSEDDDDSSSGDGSDGSSDSD